MDVLDEREERAGLNQPPPRPRAWPSGGAGSRTGCSNATPSKRSPPSSRSPSAPSARRREDAERDHNSQDPETLRVLRVFAVNTRRVSGNRQPATGNARKVSISISTHKLSKTRRRQASITGKLSINGPRLSIMAAHYQSPAASQPPCSLPAGGRRQGGPYCLRAGLQNVAAHPLRRRRFTASEQHAIIAVRWPPPTNVEFWVLSFG